MFVSMSCLHSSDPRPPSPPPPQGQVFLKGWGEGRGVALFQILFFQGLPFLHLDIALPFAKLCYVFEE